MWKCNMKKLEQIEIGTMTLEERTMLLNILGFNVIGHKILDAKTGKALCDPYIPFIEIDIMNIGIFPSPIKKKMRNTKISSIGIIKYSVSIFLKTLVLPEKIFRLMILMSEKELIVNLQ